MEKTFQYHQQIFAGLELEIYNDLLKKDKIFLQCRVSAISPSQGIRRWPLNQVRNVMSAQLQAQGADPPPPSYKRSEARWKLIEQVKTPPSSPLG
jgi:hypothetical protein